MEGRGDLLGRPHRARLPVLPVGTQQDSHLPGRKQVLCRHRICPHLELGLPSLQNNYHNLLWFRSHSACGALLDEDVCHVRH